MVGYIKSDLFSLKFLIFFFGRVAVLEGEHLLSACYIQGSVQMLWKV